MPTSKLKAWLKLIRPPNLPTVPGDPLAGYALAAAVLGKSAPWRCVAYVLSAALLIYMAGLVWNDCADRSEDARLRPTRPIPSGLVTTAQAASAAAVAAVMALGLGWLGGRTSFMVALILLALVLIYNFAARRIPVLGIVVMGSCRGVSLLLGASLQGGQVLLHPAIMAAAVTNLMYITAVSLVAFRETERIRFRIIHWAPAGAALIGSGLFAWAMRNPSAIGAALGALFLASTVSGAQRLRNKPAPAETGKQVGRFIRNLVLLQAMFCSFTPGQGPALALLLLLAWPLSLWLASRFYAS